MRLQPQADFSAFSCRINAPFHRFSVSPSGQLSALLCIPHSPFRILHWTSYSRTVVPSYSRTLFSSRVFRIPNSALRIVSCTFVLSYLRTLVRSCF